MNRCTGHCCSIFTLPESPQEVKSEEFGDKVVDGDVISDMLIPLTDYEPFNSEGQIKYFYTCKHFDGKNCTNYENRPLMCSDYPYGGNCAQLGCTLIGDTSKEDTRTSPDGIAKRRYDQLGLNYTESKEKK